MKIGFVLDDSLDKTDGVQQYVLTLGHWLTGAGHEVHYLVGQTARTDLPHIHSLSRNVQVHFNQNRMSTPRPASKQVIKQLLDTEQFDVLHVQMPYSPFLAGRIIKAASPQTAIIGTFHIIPFSGLEKVASRMLRLWLRHSLKKFDVVYSVSKPAQKFARKTFKLKSDVLPNAINLSHFQAGKPLRRYQDDKLTILFLGRLVERKGCLHFLKAISELHKQHELNRVRIVIGGKGPLLPRLRQFVAENRLKQYVQFVGYIPESDKADYLASADIAVFPSTGGESFGIVLAEAMAAGSAVVLAGNNRGYVSVMTGRKDQLFDPTNTAQFVKVLKHFLHNYRARQQAKRWQASHVTQYDVRQVGAQLARTYQVIHKKKQNSVTVGITKYNEL